MTTAPNDSAAAVFLDRDGTLMREVELLFRSETGGDFPGVPEALLRLKKAGYKLIVISNQAGIGRGYFTEAQYRLVEAEVARAVLPAHFRREFIFVRTGRTSRPSGANLHRAWSSKRNAIIDIDLARSFFIGDKAIDIECGHNAGVRTILVKTGYGANETQAAPNWVADDFAAAADIILAQTETSAAAMPWSERLALDIREHVAPQGLASSADRRLKSCDSRARRLMNSHEKIVGIIPARWGSTRFPGKPLHPIAGKPLLQHVWERCRRAKALNTVIIATDDMRIAEAAFAWGAEVSLTIAHHASGTDRIAEVATKLRGVSHIINIQGDEPLIDPKLINQLARKMQRDPKIEMITAVHPFENPADAQSPHQVKAVLDRERPRALFLALPPSPTRARRSGPIRYFRHQGIYGYRRELLLRFVRWKPSPLEKAEALEQLRALENGVNIHVVVTESGSPGVDTPDDARAIERQLLAPSRRPRQARSR